MPLARPAPSPPPARPGRRSDSGRSPRSRRCRCSSGRPPCALPAECAGKHSPSLGPRPATARGSRVRSMWSVRCSSASFVRFLMESPEEAAHETDGLPPEVRKMRFEEARGAWQERRPRQGEAARPGQPLLRPGPFHPARSPAPGTAAAPCSAPQGRPPRALSPDWPESVFHRRIRPASPMPHGMTLLPRPRGRCERESTCCTVARRVPARPRAQWGPERGRRGMHPRRARSRALRRQHGGRRVADEPEHRREPPPARPGHPGGDQGERHRVRGLAPGHHHERRSAPPPRAGPGAAPRAGVQGRRRGGHLRRTLLLRPARPVDDAIDRHVRLRQRDPRGGGGVRAADLHARGPAGRTPRRGPPASLRSTSCASRNRCSMRSA